MLSPHSISNTLLGILAACAIGACAHGESADAIEPPPLTLPVVHMRMIGTADTVRLSVWLATTADQQTTGLMERRQLADSSAMLFLYQKDEPPTAGFWMFRTRIPLDIAFMDSSGTIRSIQHMVPCPTSLAQGCPTYDPGVAYRAALEVNAGLLARRGLVFGGRMILADTGMLTRK